MTQRISLLTLSIAASAALTAETFVTAAGAVATAAGNTLGVARSDAAVGAFVPVDAIGTTTVIAGGAIAVNDRVEVGAGGKAIELAAGVPVGVALQAAAADGDRIEVLLIQN